MDGRDRTCEPSDRGCVARSSGAGLHLGCPLGAERGAVPVANFHQKSPGAPTFPADPFLTMVTSLLSPPIHSSPPEKRAAQGDPVLPEAAEEAEERRPQSCPGPLVNVSGSKAPCLRAEKAGD